MEEPKPYRSPRSTTAGSTDRRGWRLSPVTGFCLAFYSLAVLWGVRSAVAPERSLSDIVFPMVLAICLCTWAIVDARHRQKPIPRSLRLWFFVLAGIVVPGYVIGTRGWKGLGWVVLHTVAWYALATVAMYVAGYLYWGDEWIDLLTLATTARW